MNNPTIKSINPIIQHSKNYGVNITPPVLIEDYTMHFTPLLNLRCYFNTQCCYSNPFGCYFNTLWCYVQTLILTPEGVVLY